MCRHGKKEDVLASMKIHYQFHLENHGELLRFFGLQLGVHGRAVAEKRGFERRRLRRYPVGSEERDKKEDAFRKSASYDYNKIKELERTARNRKRNQKLREKGKQ